MLLEGKDFAAEPMGHRAAFPAAEAAPAAAFASVSPGEGARDRKEAARRALAAHAGNKSRAAAALGVTRKTFYAWLEAG